jgi:hypothetical protein
VFTASVSAPNGGTDEYARNDERRVDFAAVPVYTSDIAILLKTNFKGAESLYQIFDDQGKPVFTKGNFGNNLLYKDTLHLAPGCYEFVLTDAGDNGLSFFANNDGTGSCTVRLAGGGAVKTFNPDFGKETRLQFIRANTTGIEAQVPDRFALGLFPNPAGSGITVQFNLESRSTVRFELYTTLGGKVADIAASDYPSGVHQRQLDLAGLTPGTYVLMMIQNGVVVKNANINVIR